MTLRVVLAGGGTAGHIEPALSLADALRRADPDVEVTALGTVRGLETRLVPQRGYDLALIPAVPVPRRLSADLARLPARLRGAVRDTEAVLERVRADVLVGFGGYVAAPGYLAARRRRVPVVVHEANVRPGLANRLGARRAAAVATAVAGSTLPGAVHVGMPLRRAISTLDRPARRAEAREHFGLDPDRPTLLVFGGSQGARRINAALGGAAAALTAAGVQVLHAAGTGNEHEVGEVAREAGEAYRVLPYLERMDLAYAAADLAVCRAGAMTVAELCAVGLPALFVPLPIGNGEQRLNALPVVQAGGAVLVEDAALDSARVLAEVLPLLADPAHLQGMGAAAAALGRRDGDEALASMVRAAARPAASAGETERP